MNLVVYQGEGQILIIIIGEKNNEKEKKKKEWVAFVGWAICL